MQHRLMKIVMTAACSVALFLAGHAAAASPGALSAADAKAVQAVIQSQLVAFAKDDAEKAFSYAAPELRKRIGSAAAFMSMVRSSYPVVYRPASVTFLKAESEGAGTVQQVQMLDANGASYLAVYSLQRQKDKTWRISGCTVVDNKGRMA